MTSMAYTTLLKDGISLASLDIGIRGLPLPFNYLKLGNRPAPDARQMALSGTRVVQLQRSNAERSRAGKGKVYVMRRSGKEDVMARMEDRKVSRPEQRRHALECSLSTWSADRLC